MEITHREIHLWGGSKFLTGKSVHPWALLSFTLHLSSRWCGQPANKQPCLCNVASLHSVLGGRTKATVTFCTVPSRASVWIGNVPVVQNVGLSRWRMLRLVVPVCLIVTFLRRRPSRCCGSHFTQEKLLSDSWISEHLNVRRIRRPSERSRHYRSQEKIMQRLIPPNVSWQFLFKTHYKLWSDHLHKCQLMVRPLKQILISTFLAQCSGGSFYMFFLFLFWSPINFFLCIFSPSR